MSRTPPTGRGLEISGRVDRRDDPDPPAEIPMKRLAYLCGQKEDRQVGTADPAERAQGGRWRPLMPHPAPCWCRECWNAYVRAEQRVRRGQPADWTPAPRPCEGCGWSFVPPPARHLSKRWCTPACRKLAVDGTGPGPEGSCRIYWSTCTCGATVGPARRPFAPGKRCPACTRAGRNAVQRRKREKRAREDG